MLIFVYSLGGLQESADGFAQVYPEHKYLIVETFRQRVFKCGMTGDGMILYTYHIHNCGCGRHRCGAGCGRYHSHT